MIKREINPLMSYSAEEGELGTGVVVRFHDETSHEIVAEYFYEDPERLEGIAYGMQTASDILVSILVHGYDAAVEEHHLEHAMVKEDLSNRDLTVDDILSAGDGISDIVDS